MRIYITDKNNDKLSLNLPQKDKPKTPTTTKFEEKTRKRKFVSRLSTAIYYFINCPVQSFISEVQPKMLRISDLQTDGKIELYRQLQSDSDVPPDLDPTINIFKL